MEKEREGEGTGEGGGGERGRREREFSHSAHLFFETFLQCVCVYVGGCSWICIYYITCVCVFRLENDLQESILSFYIVGSKDQSQVTTLHRKCLSCLAISLTPYLLL